ncbi:MAG: 50S ribosomal protein L21 [Bacteroidales bacterium]|nr:50S ribosomal protein L21 [Bacteroidales bacterium]HCI55460.1 50S ribosomal protein L21 [Bacteroidales bacterium]
MYAIVEIAGQQFKIEEGKKIFVHRLAAENGEKVEFDHVLLIEDDGKVVVGEPLIKDAFVEATVLDHLKGDKVVVFKKKRRKGYRVKNGHRQYFTQVEIMSIKNKTPRVKTEKKEKLADDVNIMQPEVINTPQAEEKETIKDSDTSRTKEVKKKTTVKSTAKKGSTRKKTDSSKNED